jgi:hypothetical protein
MGKVEGEYGRQERIERTVAHLPLPQRCQLSLTRLPLILDRIRLHPLRIELPNRLVVRFLTLLHQAFV